LWYDADDNQTVRFTFAIPGFRVISHEALASWLFETNAWQKVSDYRTTLLLSIFSEITESPAI